jgi:hypothetical protein
MLLIMSLVLLALSSVAPKSVGNCQAADHVIQGTSDILHENVLPLFSRQTQDEPKGCCCIMTDSGPPKPTWSCQGVTPGTMETKRQCAEDADAASTKYKWHEGQCTGKE